MDVVLTICNDDDHVLNKDQTYAAQTTCVEERADVASACVGHSLSLTRVKQERERNYNKWCDGVLRKMFGGERGDGTDLKGV